MSEAAAGGRKALIIGVGTRVCAIPLTHVIETMRPLPVEAISAAPLFVRGVAIIRGIPTLVVDLGTILGMSNELTGERLVIVRVGARQVAVFVNKVFGIHDLDALRTQELPPLLQEASRDVVERIGILDEQFLMVLRAGWRLSDEIWDAVVAQEVPQ